MSSLPAEIPRLEVGTAPEVGWAAPSREPAASIGVYAVYWSVPRRQDGGGGGAGSAGA